MRPALLAVLLAVSLAGPASAAYNRQYLGTTGGNFLKLPVDARGTAMGGAMGAVSEDAAALHWNPAGLSGMTERHVMLTHVSHFEGVFQDFLAYAQPIESLIARNSRGRRRELEPTGLGTLAVGLNYLNAGELQERTNQNGKLTGGSFKPSDLAVIAGWGGSFTRAVDAGVSVKYIRSTIRQSAQTGAFDGGLRYRLRAGPVPLTASFSAHNLFGHLRFGGQTDPLPQMYRTSIAARIMPWWLLAAEGVIPRDNNSYFAVGSEWSRSFDSRPQFRVPGISLAFRCGYNALSTSGDLDGLAGLTFGGGIHVQRLGFDYAWMPYGSLGDSHRFTLNYRF